ncbi:MAG TPA: hypothetical protein VLB44_18830, partial [Kofleriaceae bacterium]|nr:hypothetical protein [Kofleriaceae bacterium]
MRADSTASNAAPLDPTKAAGAIRAASDRRRIFELLLRAVRTKTRFAALLSVHTDDLRGQLALADPAFDCRGVGELRIPRNLVKRFEAAISSGSPSVGAITTGESFIDGYVDTLGHPSGPVLVMPIVIGPRVVALVVAHRGDAPLKIEDVSDLFPLIASTSQALARIIATRGRAATSPSEADSAARLDRPDTVADAGYEVEVIVTDVAAKRRQLAALREKEAWPQLAEALRELVREGVEHGDPAEEEQLELLFELGTVERDHGGRPDRAIEAWRSAQTIDAGDPRLLDALEQVFVQQGQWSDVADVLEKKAALADTVA